MTDLMERVDERGDGVTNRPLPILLCVTLGGSAVLLFAMASGHLKGTQATSGSWPPWFRWHWRSAQ